MLNRIRSIFFENWMSKLACLAIAFTLWFWVNIQQTGEETFRVPVEFSNTPGNLLVTERSNRTVNVTLQGPKSSLLGMDQSDISVQLDLNKQTAGAHTVWSRELSIDKPDGLEITNIQPNTLRVVLARKIRKSVPVVPIVSNGPPEGFDYEIDIKPDTALVEGPAEKIKTISELKLQPQNLSNQTENYTVRDSRVQLPENVELVDPDRNAFNLSVKIFQKKITRKIQNVPVTVTDIPEGMKASVEPQKIDLLVRGPKTSVENLSVNDIRVTVKAPEEDTGMVIRVASINLPNGVELVNNTQDIPAFKVRVESR